MLLDLSHNISSWNELESRISALPTEQGRGAAFEEFCAAYFALSDLLQFKEVYRHNEIPPSLCRQLGYPESKDIGIDGLGVACDGKEHHSGKAVRVRQDSKIHLPYVCL